MDTTLCLGNLLEHQTLRRPRRRLEVDIPINLGAQVARVSGRWKVPVPVKKSHNPTNKLQIQQPLPHQILKQLDPLIFYSSIPQPYTSLPLFNGDGIRSCCCWCCCCCCCNIIWCSSSGCCTWGWGEVARGETPTHNTHQITHFRSRTQKTCTNTHYLSLFSLITIIITSTFKCIQEANMYTKKKKNI